MRKRQVKWHLRSIELWWEEGNKLIVKDIFSHRYCLLSLYRLSLTPLRYRLSKSRPYRKYLFTNSNTKCHLSITEFRLFPSILKVSCDDLTDDFSDKRSSHEGLCPGTECLLYMNCWQSLLLLNRPRFIFADYWFSSMGKPY